MFKRSFGCLAFLMGVALGIGLIYVIVTGKAQGSWKQRLGPLLLPALFIWFGVTWMRGKTLTLK